MRSTTTGTPRSRVSGVSAALAMIALAVIALTGCSSGGANTSAAGDSSAAGSGGGALESGVAQDRAPSAGQAPGRAPGANRAPVQTRAVIRTGQLYLTSDHLDRTRAEVDRLLFGFDGSIDTEETTHARDGSIASSRLVLRVPVAKFTAAMDALEKLGRVESSQSRAKDVTTQVIDVAERVQTLQNSLDRLQRFQQQAADIDDLIRFEDQITDRESQLRSLQAQQDYLADQTSMATITLYLSRPSHPVTPPGPLADAGFLTGLRNGWAALADTVVVTLTVAGAVLPFLGLAALVGVPTWLLVRRTAKRRGVAESPAPPEA